MNHETSTHLTREAMLRWQLGDASAKDREHVAACAACRAQMQSTADSLNWFGAAAREWGEEKARVSQEWKDAKAAAALEWSEANRVAASEWRQSKAAAARQWRPMLASWAMACVVLLLVFGIGLPRWKAHRQALEAQARQQQMQQELARDNALMEEVDQDVSQVVPEAMEPLSWASTTNITGTTGSTARQ